MPQDNSGKKTVETQQASPSHKKPLILIAPSLAVLLFLAAIALNAALSHKAEASPYTPTYPETIDHTQFFEEAGISVYEGSRSCIACHYDEVLEFHQSYHYQMASPGEGIVGAGADTLAGGRVLYNDFCGAMFWSDSPVNWIGYVTLKKTPEGYEHLMGEFTGLTGCSMCHGVGMGLPPSWEPTQEQLENIDCLACHVDPSVYVSGPMAIDLGLKTVVKDEQGRWRYVVNVSLDKIAPVIIDKPRNENCLACHAYSGGGPHLKRPNLGPDLYDGVTDEGKVFDVHIASNVSCIDCHPGSGHRFTTSGADTWAREGIRPGETALSCTDCHGSEPHEGLMGAFLNTFHERVACQTCHIPVIGGGDTPTELFRDWSATTFLAAKKRWKFSIPDPRTLSTDKWYLVEELEPVYAWYGGERIVYLPPVGVEPIRDDRLELQPVDGESAGVVYYVKPAGSRDDGESKIYPFKLHRSVAPYSTVNKTLVPMKVGIAFATGDAKLATIKGANTTGIIWDGKTYVTLVRYMQVNHGIRPSEEALSCLDCHGTTIDRINWPELGYGRFPQIAFTLGTVSVIALVAGLALLTIQRLKAR